MVGVPITAAICTRNRGAALVPAVRSILANDHPAFRLIVVDQSTNDDATNAVAEFRADSRFDYVRSDTVGLSRARNVALRRADTEVVVFTDDDCEVLDPHWLETMQRIFDDQSRVLVAFCSTLPGPFDPNAGFIPTYECRGTRVIRSVFGKCTARGIGAGIAVRRGPLLERLGGFDEMLGAGGVFPAAEDGDIAARALLAGFEVCETDRTHVIHHGFRNWAEGRELGRRDWVGIGAAFAKPLKCGHWGFLPVPLYELLAVAMWPPLNDALHLRRPRGVGRGVHFLRGFVRGLRAPVEPDRILFVQSNTNGR